MPNRRFFLKNCSKALAALGFTPLLKSCANENPNPNATEMVPAEPLVATTWNNLKATENAWKVVQNGGYALDAVEIGVKTEEANPENQYVGLGGLPDREGIVTLDASIMDEHGRGGCVAFLEGIKHPIGVARKVMENTPHVLLVGEGARQFALEQGFQIEDLLTEKSKQDYLKWLETAEYKPVVNAERHDTIGMLALDNKTRLCGACTTSGMPYKMRGRVGDSPILGAGMYVDGEVGAATTSGLGELVLRTLGSFVVVEEMRRGAHPMEACRLAVKRIADRMDIKDKQVGYVAINRKGEYGGFAIHPGFNYTIYQNGKMQVFDAESFTK